MPEVVFGIDGFGDPILLAAGAPRLDKTGGAVAIAVKSGNPFRDPGSGTFGNGPAGAKVVKGGDILKTLTQPAQLYVTQMRNKTGANSISVDIVGGRAQISLLKDGAQVAKLDLPIPRQAQGAATQAAGRDAVVDRARSSLATDKLDQPAREQRINDLVDYLYARYNATGAIFSKPGTVRVEAPAGWDKKTISGLSDNELRDVANRMQARGWSDQAVEKLLLPNVTAQRRNKITKGS